VLFRSRAAPAVPKGGPKRPAPAPAPVVQPPAAPVTGPPQTEAAVDNAVALGIRFLCSSQAPDGSIVGDVKGAGRDGGAHKAAMTSLAILALASVGNQPTDSTPEGRVMAKALSFVLLPENQSASTGLMGSDDQQGNGRAMYLHGITTLMLAEMLGMGADSKQDTELRDRLNKAIGLIIKAQQVKKSDPKYEGGWRYLPTARDGDISVTVWQVMALRAAKNAGVDVPKEAIDKAIGFLHRSFSGNATRGGFGYMPSGREGGGGGPGGGAMSCTAEGLLALQVCAEYDSAAVKGSAENLMNIATSPVSHFYYTYYYYAQGMYQAGGISQKYADASARQAPAALLPYQDAATGAWKMVSGNESAGGAVYCTSMAILSLSVKYHYLPIYQR
jgi:hypothetical protein